MKYELQTFELLSRGVFISSDSRSEEKRRIYMDIEDNLTEYYDYFRRIGFKLEQGNGFYYFSRTENRTTMVEKLNRFGHWLDILDFVKAWQPTFGSGFVFTKADMTAALNADIDLQQKSVSLYDNRSVYGEIVARLLEEMLKAGYIDIVNEDRQEYIVLCTITYLEDIVNLIITDEDIASDEIPE